MAKKLYHIQLTDFTFYDSSPYSFLPDTEIFTFRTARQRDNWLDDFTLSIQGILSYTVHQQRKYKD